MFSFMWKGSEKKDCDDCFVFRFALPVYIQGIHRDSNCVNKTHIQAIRVHFFCHADICQLLFPRLIHAGLPSVLISHLSHQRNITVYHDFRPCKALLIKAMVLIQKEWPTFWQQLLIMVNWRIENVFCRVGLVTFVPDSRSCQWLCEKCVSCIISTFI